MPATQLLRGAHQAKCAVNVQAKRANAEDCDISVANEGLVLQAKTAGSH
jgi:hypothetical protein